MVGFISHLFKVKTKPEMQVVIYHVKLTEIIVLLIK